MAGYTMNGLAQGIQIGNSLVDAYYRGQDRKDQAEVKNVMAEGLTAAKADRQAAVDSNVNIGGKANADNTMTMPTYQDAGGKDFADEQSLKKNAEKVAPSVDDFYLKNVVPKIQETYIKQGNQQGADQWGQWAENKHTQNGMKYWTQALRAGQMGDYKGYADSMVKAYNAPGYYEDGLEAEGYDLIKDKSDNVTGLTLNLRNKETGEKFSQSIHGTDDMVRQGIGLLDPANAFKTTMAQANTAQALQAKQGMANQKFQNDVYRDDRKAQTQLSLQDRKEGSAMERMLAGKRADVEKAGAAMQSKVAALKSAGYSDDFVKEALPQMLGIGQFKKPAAPEEIRRMLHQARLSDFNYQRKTPAEQSAIIAQDEKLIMGGSAPSANPMARGISLPPQDGGAAPAQRPPMIYDSKTGQMVPYQK